MALAVSGREFHTSKDIVLARPISTRRDEASVTLGPQLARSTAAGIARIVAGTENTVINQLSGPIDFR